MSTPHDAPVECLHCGRMKRPRCRGLCRVCHRKLSEHGLAMPPKRRPGQRPVPLPTLVRAWVRAMPEAQRVLYRTALEDFGDE